MPIEYRTLTTTDHILTSNCQGLVNTVNCVGVMGKGLAEQFKEAYHPQTQYFKEYLAHCRAGTLKPGMILPYQVPGGPRILSCATKDHWNKDSQLIWIEAILARFSQNHQRLHIQSCAWPILGCGNGNLEWRDVGPRMAQALQPLPIHSIIYLPRGYRQY